MRPHTIKRTFDVQSRTDRNLYRQYLQTGGWGLSGCPFEAELPYLSVPDTISSKIVAHALKLPWPTATK